MGIGNTAASSMWMTCLTQIPLIDCVGAGSGLDSEGVRHKYNVLKRSLENYSGDGSAGCNALLRGYEMVMAVECALRAAELEDDYPRDGFIMTNCVLVLPLISGDAPVLRIRALRRRGRQKRVLDFGGESIARSRATAGRRSGSVCLPDTRLRRSTDQ